MQEKGFVVSAVLYPLLILFLAILMGLLAMMDTRKKILDKMKLEIADSIFDETNCDCEKILDKLNYIIKNGASVGVESGLNLSVTAYLTKAEIPQKGNLGNEIAILSEVQPKSYYLSATEPIYKEEGTLWLHATQGNGNSLKNWNYYLPIRYISQYLKGSWVKVDAYLFDDTGLGWVAINDDSKETATPKTIAAGYTAIVNGKKVTGTLTDTGIYFEAKQEKAALYLRGRPVTYDYDNTETYGKLFIEWESDEKNTIRKTIATDTASTYYEIQSAFQVSDDVIAMIYIKTTDTENSETLKRRVTYYLTTLKSTATSLTQVSNISLTSSSYMDNIWTDTDTVSKYIDIYFDFYEMPGYEKKYEATSEWTRKYVVDLEKIEDYIDYNNDNNTYTTTTYKKTAVSINGISGKATIYENTTDEEGNAITNSAGCSEKYYDTTMKYSDKTGCVKTETGVLKITYSNTYHTDEVSSRFMDIRGNTQKSTTIKTDSIASEEAFQARNLSKYFSSLKMNHYRVDVGFKVGATDKKVDFYLYQASLNHENIFSTDSLLSKNKLSLDLTTVVPDGFLLNMKKLYFEYSNITKEAYAILPYYEAGQEKGRVYLILGVNQNIECNPNFDGNCLSFYLKSFSYREHFTGQKVGEKVISRDVFKNQIRKLIFYNN